MSKKPTLYVAYGSNMNLPQMALRCPTAEVVATSELKDFELLFRAVAAAQWLRWNPRRAVLFLCCSGRSGKRMRLLLTGTRDIPIFMTNSTWR